MSLAKIVGLDGEISLTLKGATETGQERQAIGQKLSQSTDGSVRDHLNDVQLSWRVDGNLPRVLMYVRLSFY